MSDSNLEKILIIDDNSDYRKLINTFISKLLPGAEVIEYDPVFEGVPDDDFDWSSIDVLLLDYHLSIVGTTGLDILHKHHKKNTFPATIMLTGAGTEEIAIRALKSGIHEYLPKQSLTKDKLKQSIIHAWEDKKAERQKKQELTQHNRSFSKEVFYENLERAFDSKGAERALVIIRPDNLDVLEGEIGIIGRDSLINHIARHSYEVFKLGASNPNITKISETEIGIQIDFPINLETLDFNMQGLCTHLSKCAFKFAEEKYVFSVSIGVLKLGLFNKPATQLINIASLACDHAGKTIGNSYYIWKESDVPPVATGQTSIHAASIEATSSNENKNDHEAELKAKEEELQKQATMRAEQEAQEKAEAKIKAAEEAKLEAELKAKAETERAKEQAELRAAQEAKEKEIAEAEIRMAKEEKEKLEAQLKAKEEELQKQAALRAEQEAQEKAEAEAKIKAAEEAKTNLEAELKAKAETERAKEEAELRAAKEAKEKLIAEAEMKAAKEEKEKLEAELKAKEEEIKKQAALRDEQAAKEKAEAEAKIKAAEEEKEKLQAELKAKEEEAQKQTALRAEQEATEKAEAEAKIKAAEEEKRKLEAELEAKAIAEKSEAASRIEQEEREKLEAEAKMKAVQEEREKLEAELKAIAKAKEEAETEMKAAKEEKEKLEAELKAIAKAREEAEISATAAKDEDGKDILTKDATDKAVTNTIAVEEERIKPTDKESNKDIVEEPESSEENTGPSLVEIEKKIRKLIDENKLIQTYQPITAMFADEEDSREIYKTGLQALSDSDELNQHLIDTSVFSIELQQTMNEWILRQVFLRITESGTGNCQYLFLITATESWFSDIALFQWLQKILSQTKKYNPGRSIILNVPLDLFAKHQKRAQALIDTLRKSHNFTISLSNIYAVENISEHCSLTASNLLIVDTEQLKKLSETLAPNSEIEKNNIDSADSEGEEEQEEKQNLLQYLKSQNIKIITSGIEDSTLLTDAITAGTDYTLGDFVGEVQENLTETSMVESFELT